MPASVRIESAVLWEMTSHALEDPRRECCGLLAGSAGAITQALRAENAAANRATSYEIAPAELFRLTREIRAAELELLGIYHSHPNGKSEPSSRDIATAYYPDVAYFILLPRKDAPQPVRAFSIRDGRVDELRIQIV